MMSKRATLSALDRRAAANAYFDASKKPLQILVFLLPLVIVYEIGLAFFLPSDEGVLTNKAHETLLRFFDTFGITAGGGLYLGGIALVIVLLVWHILTKDKWKIDASALGFMSAESVLLTIPLIVLAQVILRSSSNAEAIATSLAVAAPQQLGSLSIWSKLAISVGAGLYEELLFRMLLIAVIHTLLVDVVKISTRRGATIAVIISAMAFTIYHPLDGTSSVVFYFIAGLYFGSVYVVRGFGIVVGVHAVYDIIMVSMLP